MLPTGVVPQGLNTSERVMYPIYRPTAKFEEPYEAEDCTFSDARLDDKEIGDVNYRHCTFVDASFKGATLQDCQFLHCTFLGCYFRRTTLKNCTFTGCRFYDCQFPYVSLHTCDFKYSLFKSCQVLFSEMEHSLPSAPNLREQLCRNLAIQSADLGLSDETRRYRRLEVEAREEHLWNGITGESEWYIAHFTGRRFRAGCQWMLSKMNCWLWGYGERLIVLLRNLLLVVVVVFPFLYWLLADLTRNDGASLDLWDYLYFSAVNALPVGVSSTISASGWIGYSLVVVEAIFGSVTLALFAAYVFRWSLHR